MKITIEIDEQEIQNTVMEAVKEKIRRRIERDWMGDVISPYWQKIDRAIENYIESPEFSDMIQKTIEDTQPEIVQAVKDRITGNF